MTKGFTRKVDAVFTREVNAAISRKVNAAITRKVDAAIRHKVNAAIRREVNIGKSPRPTRGYGSPRYSIMMRTWRTVSSLLFLYGRPRASSAATRSGQLCIHPSNERTASRGDFPGKYMLANSRRFIFSVLKN